MKWFKFYGQDYLSDPKMLALSASERSCWITLLSYSSVNDNGVITFLSEQQLMLQAGLDFTREEWERTVGILEKLKNLKMIDNDNGVITLLNWKKRQETSLTSYERVKKYREKKRNDNENDNTKITLEENRIEENRIDKGDTSPTKKEDFIKFWEEYPKKVERKKCEEKWLRLSLEVHLAILKDIPLRKEGRQWEEGYIPNPLTYLNGERWNDDIEKSKEEPIKNNSIKL